MRQRYSLVLALIFLGIIHMAVGRENVPRPGGNSGRTQMRTSSGCVPASSTSTLDINNVRALLQNGGDMWWDLVSLPRYEVPKVDDPAAARFSLFAGSLWIGGIDASGQLRIAAQTYRQQGNDYFPGPISKTQAATTADLCKKWDKHFKINKTDIDRFRVATSPTEADHPAVFAWPAYNKTRFQRDFDYSDDYSTDLAPWFEAPGDNPDNDPLQYNPEFGDYPDIQNSDQAIWWVINDKGNIHTETGGQQIGVEIQVMAFGFTASNAVNSMTFYKQRVINRSSLTLNQTYIGQWVDADLGFAFDDYVGCDTCRGLGYCYNGAPIDQPLAQGYGSEPPAVGVDFFQGPIADANDGIDNNHNGIIDEQDTSCTVDRTTGSRVITGERIGMSRFVYYNNDFAVNGNPEQAVHYYSYLIGVWKNGSRMIDDRRSSGGNGNGLEEAAFSAERGRPAANYMFPDYPGNRCGAYINCPMNETSDRWNETTSGNPPQDRRFLQSAGPFTLRPGAENEIIVGVVWARDRNNAYDIDQLGSVCMLLQADDIAQALFDFCFELLSGPDAPDLTIEEYDRELILRWQYNNINSNNAFENYRQLDPVLAKNPAADADFRFQGYMVYQVIDAGVKSSELGDINRARLIAQCDIKDEVSTIINREEVDVPGQSQPLINDRIMVEGNNQGLFHSLRVTEDAFAEGQDRRLVNYRSYYFLIIAYAHNDTSSDGRKFIAGNNNVGDPNNKQLPYVGVPHKVSFERNGTILNAGFSDGPKVTRIAGNGNGGNFVELTEETRQRALQNNVSDQLVYEGGTAAPIRVKVVHPKALKPKKYELEVVRDQPTGKSVLIQSRTYPIFSDWVLRDKTQANRIIYQSEYIKLRIPVPGTDEFREEPTPLPLVGEERYILEKYRDENNRELEVDHGFSVAVKNVLDAGNPKETKYGFIDAKIEFDNRAAQWLTGIRDQDYTPQNGGIFNWIRAGTCDRTSRLCRDAPTSAWSNGGTVHTANRMVDPEGYFQKALNGTWAPYCLAAPYDLVRNQLGPGMPIARALVGNPPRPSNFDMDPSVMVNLTKLPNIDLFITSDPQKWSRCVVVETSPAKNIGSGSHIMTAKRRKNAEILGSRVIMPADASNVDGVAEYGLSYFPGYAINVDTGERLYVFFGESTWHKDLNGDDMLFNPTDNAANRSVQFTDLVSAGGRHYIYVTKLRYGSPEAKALEQRLRVDPNWRPFPESSANPFTFQDPTNPTNSVSMQDVWKDVAWTSIPVVSELKYAYKNYDKIPTGVKISLRVTRAFTTDVNPKYEFDMTPFATVTNDNATAKSALELIRVVPNPYYARSGVGRGRYEVSQLDSRVKITNLPQRCIIRVFTINGTLVRTYNKDNDNPDQQWDLKNDVGVPISSGMYLIHIEAPGIGERVLKFLCAMPEVDLNAY